MATSTGALEFGLHTKADFFRIHFSFATDLKFDESQKSPLRVLNNLHVN